MIFLLPIAIIPLIYLYHSTQANKARKAVNVELLRLGYKRARKR